MLSITCPECSLRIHRNCSPMIRCGTTCSSRSQNPTLGMQILLILWLQVMYHQGKIKEISSTKVISTYGMNRTSSESALTAYSEDVYRRGRHQDYRMMPLITIWRTLWCIPHSFNDLAKWILLANHV